MGRPRKTIRSTSLHLAIPEDLRSRLDVLLVSPAEKTIRPGAYQEFFIGLLNDFFSKSEPNLDKTPSSVWIKVYRGLEHIEAISGSPDVKPVEALSRVHRWSQEYKALLTSKEAETGKK